MALSMSSSFIEAWYLASVKSLTSSFLPILVSPLPSGAVALGTILLPVLFHVSGRRGYNDCRQGGSGDEDHSIHGLLATLFVSILLMRAKKCCFREFPAMHNLAIRHPFLPW